MLVSVLFSAFRKLFFGFTLRFSHPSSLAGLLADIDPVTGVVLLHLHRLHLLLDGLHGEAVEEGSETTLAGGRLIGQATLTPALLLTPLLNT